MRKNEMQVGSLGDFSDFGDYGEFNPLWGYVIGGGVTGAAILTFKALGHHLPTWAKYAGLAGLGVGALTSGALMLSHKTRRAGYLSTVASVLSAVPEIVRSFVLVPQGLGDAYDMGLITADMAGMGLPAIEIQGVPQFGQPAPLAVLQGAQPSLGYTAAELAGVNW